MKKSIVTIMSLLVLVLSACGGSQSAAVTEQAAEVNEAAEVVVTEATAAEAYPTANETTGEVATTGVLNADYENAVSVEMQLVLGTLKLSGTDQAITAEQANALLPLWSDYQTALQSAMPNMGEPGQSPQPGQDASGTPAADMGTPQAMPTVDPAMQTQLDDLMAQIESAMTAEQIAAIAAMQITTETAMTMMQEQMATMGAAQGDGSGQQPPQGGQGQMPQGTPGAGGGQMGAQGGLQGGLGMGGAQGGMLQPQLVQAVITALQTIAGVESTSS